MAQLVVCAVVGLAFVMFGGASSWWLSPGPVTRAHGEIPSCAGCHSAFERGVASWLSAAINGTDLRLESGKCIACHDMGSDALFAHSMSVEAMEVFSQQTVSTRMDPVPLAGALLFHERPEVEKEPVPCSRCHSEHHGRDEDLARVAEARCQSCHQLQFPSFSDGHPRFEGYPSSRRPHVSFDHARHFNRHFPESGKQPPSTCGSCHIPDDFGRDMVVRSFDDTCADCHLGQINGVDRTAGSRAIAVFRVPGLDAETLKDREFDIGDWPRFAEDEPTPFMRLLMSGDPEVRRDLRTVSGLDDPLDLREAEPEQLEAAARVAWAVKELIYDVMVVGVDAISERVESTTGRPLNRADLVELVGALPREVMASAQQEWFPNLLTEVPNFRSEAVSQGSNLGPSEASPEDLSPESGGDPSAGAVEPGDEESGDDLLASDDLLGEDEDADLLESDDLLGEEADDLLADDGLLTDDELLGDDELWQADDELFDFAEPEELTDALIELPSIDPEEWASLGGWYRSELTLYYRPIGHSDSFMGTWLEVLSRTFGTRHERTSRPLFQSLTDPFAPGACTKCHRVDRTTAGELGVSWSPSRQPRPEEDFTVFSHVSHFSLPGGAECVSCHKPAAAGDVAPASANVKSEGPMPSFLDIEKEMCSGCHVEQGAGENCTMCHGYHVGVSRHRSLGSEIGS